MLCNSLLRIEPHRIAINPNLFSGSSHDGALPGMAFSGGLSGAMATVTALLARHGFEKVRPEQLSLRAQIELFAGAAAVLALHGSALTNILFSPPGTPVIELQAEGFNPGGVPWNWILASLREQPFAQVVCPLADTLHELPHASRDVTVDAHHLDELLRGLLTG